MPEAKTSKTSI
jgi:hypothetical protein